MLVIEHPGQSLALLAFPVRQGEQVVAVIGSPVPAFRFAKNRKKILKELKETAAKISRAITKQKRGGNKC